MSDESDDVNISKLREMALRGDDYRETFEFTYYNESGELFLKPLNDEQFLPIAAALEEKLDIDPEEAQEALEEERDPDGNIDPSDVDEELIAVMQEVAALGIDTEQGIAEGEDREGVREIVSMLQGGKSLEVGERVLKMSSDAESAERFRRDGGGK